MDVRRLRHRIHDEKQRLQGIWAVTCLPPRAELLPKARLFLTAAELYVRDVFRCPLRGERLVHLGDDRNFWIRDFTEVSVLRQIFVDECYSHRSLPASAHVILDLGCNVGATLVWLTDRYPEASIIGIEADPRTAELARRNTAGRPRITVENAAVSDHTGSETLWRSTQQSWAAALGTGVGDPVTVPAISLDDLLEKYDLRHVDLLKIDVEGAEHATLGATHRLPDVAVIIGEFHPLPDHDWDHFELMLSEFAVEQIGLPNGGLIDFIAVQR